MHPSTRHQPHYWPSLCDGTTTTDTDSQGCFLLQIESRLLPCGLHVVGSPPTAEEAIATLVNIAEIDRPDNDPPIKGLPGLLATSIGRNIEEIYANSNKVPFPSLLISCCPPCLHFASIYCWNAGLVSWVRNDALQETLQKP